MSLARRRRRRLELIEAQLEDAPPESRLPVALQAAGEIFGAAGVSPLERDAAAVRVVAGLPVGWQRHPELAEDLAEAIAVSLATSERRMAVRAALADLAAVARGDLPLLAGELERVVAERMPEDEADDVVWIAAVARSFGRE
ncbi:MAG: hypothetical protein ACRDN6_08330 [Gaiellaceae bacterium]